MSNQKLIENIVSSLVGQRNVVAVQKEFVYLLDYDHAAAIMLTQLIYWSDRTKNRDGWVYKSAEDWETEIAITRRQSDRIKTKLIEKGYVETDVRKANGIPTTHYRVLLENVTNDLVSQIKKKYDDTETCVVSTETCINGAPNGAIFNSNYNNNYSVGNVLTDKPEERQVPLSENALSGLQEGGEVVYTNSKPKPVKKRKMAEQDVVVDIIRNSDKAKNAVSSDIPEIYIPYAKAFMDGTGLKYVKRFFGDWVSTFSDWISLGYSPVDVRDAIDAIIDEGKSDYISRPGSINWKLQSMSVRKPKERVYKDVTGMEDE